MPSIKELRQICQKSEQAPSWRTQSIEGKFNRIFSIYLTWIFIHLRVPVIAVNIAGALLYLGGVGLFIFNDLKLQVLGLFLMFWSFILDACDGELARYQRLSKEKMAVGGDYIEPISHDIMYALSFFPIGLGLTISTGNLLPIAAAFVATVGKLLFRLAELRFDSLMRILAGQKGANAVMAPNPNKETPATITYFIYRNFFTSTGIFFPLIITTILRRVDWFLYFYVVSLVLFWIYKMLRQWKKIKKMSIPTENPLN